jgi:ABC-type branched-subunit amino acid transport system ATPase component
LQENETWKQIIRHVEMQRGGVQSCGHFIKSKQVSNEMWKLQDIVRTGQSVAKAMPVKSNTVVVAMTEEEKKREVQAVLQGIDPAEFEDFFGTDDSELLQLED